MYAAVLGAGLFGMNAFMVESEVNISRGQPSFDIVGLPDAAVTESRLRIRSALENSGIKSDVGRIIVNLAPASVKKAGSMYDLPILVSLLLAREVVTADISDCCFIGELSLSGGLNHTNGALAMALEAHRNGVRRLFLPAQNAREASCVDGLEVFAVENVEQLVRHLRGEKFISPQAPYKPEKANVEFGFDFSGVKGQALAKTALEIAAAGGHNVLLIGPPGTGKSLLSKCIPSILPQMSFAESIETTKIHSVAGIVDRERPLVTERPFRPVSHTASAVGLVGGGSIPRPGEISLAHNGVLFLDEFPEFDRRVLETLRQPLEDRSITISRANGSVTYPCDIMLVAAMNPCPCGNFGSPKKACSCSSKQRAAYLNRISQPVLDRIDIQVEVAPVNYAQLSDKRLEEPSADILRRVEAARKIQLRRFSGTPVKNNASIPNSMLRDVCQTEADGAEFLRGVFDRMGLSARAYDRILKVARTAADLGGSEKIRKADISLAVQFRSLDRKYWPERG